ncbi:TonB-dependent receptor [Rufibacter hautae]|uniref:TonB-dependent receptor plug domain-containing protein n=1 Tax=Rufibacter hautae TaxID=2595005 RepID=A0A5B6THG6_9BACT|nr:TonB-dependent receptor [Rufibacter hautae]KAA3439703.1 TonB-dependent receptor plug domain-containing protein [Rufibacter hautae]
MSFHFRFRGLAGRSLRMLAGLVLLLLPLTGFAQKHTISGYVRDAQTGENLIGVAILNSVTGQGTATNAYGFYSLTLPKDSVKLVLSYVGYERKTFSAYLDKDVQQNLLLTPFTTALQEVEIVNTREEDVRESTRMSTINMSVAQIKSVPALFGEVDVLKTLQLLPGVQSGGEGSSGLYVRGGGPDQNLILLDGVPVYNASHLFGFFSVFTAEALNNVELVKGGFPARYGGRLSSVLDISMKEGNMNEVDGEGSIGLIASRLTVGGPIKKDVSSFIFSGRRTYIDVLARPFMNKEDGVAGYYFYDLNGKLNWKVSDKDRLYLSAYTGYDEFYADVDRSGDKREKSTAGLGWGNLTSAFRWNRIINQRLFLNTHLTYTKYQFDISSEEESVFQDRDVRYKLKYLSNIRDLSAKVDFDFIPNPNHYIRFGGQYVHHQFQPGALQVQDNSEGSAEDLQVNTQKTVAQEVGLYLEDDLRLSDRVKVNVGVRANSFLVNRETYSSIEPRASVRFIATEKLSLKASYTHMTQFIHLLTNSGIGLPTDLWVPSTEKIKPQRSRQVALGATRTIAGDKLEISLEGYYKTMRNLIEYKEGASFIGISNSWDTKVTTGKGDAYGVELFLHKKTGRTNGWIGYTLAWSNRQFAELNDGREFPYRYDRRHDFEVVVIHQLKPNLSLSATWVYGTGNAVTLPEARYVLGEAWEGGYGGTQTYNDYGDRNGYRMASYHRADISLSHTKKKRWGEVVNNLSFYNAYNRKNPYFIYVQAGRNEGDPPRFRQISLFPILPSISKTFKF